MSVDGETGTVHQFRRPLNKSYLSPICRLIIRRLVILGYADLMKERAAQKYMSGKITLSEAAHQADLTLWEMEQCLVERGFKSSYSLEDLKREANLYGA